MGSALALLSAALFAVAAITVRRGMRGSTAITATLISIVTNVVALWALAALSGGIGLLTLPAVAMLLAAGLFAPALARFTYYEAMKRIGVARASTISNTTPIFAAVLAVPILGEHVSWWLAVGTVLVVLGLALTILPDEGTQTGRPWTGTLLALNSAVLASISFMLRKLGLRMLPDAAVAAALTVTGSLLLLPYTALRSRTQPLRAERPALVLLIISAVFTTGGFLAYFYALNLSDVVRVTPLSNTTPLFALLLLALFRQETVRPGTVAGAVLAVAGILFVVGS